MHAQLEIWKMAHSGEYRWTSDNKTEQRNLNPAENPQQDLKPVIDKVKTEHKLITANGKKTENLGKFSKNYLKN